LLSIVTGIHYENKTDFARNPLAYYLLVVIARPPFYFDGWAKDRRQKFLAGIFGGAEFWRFSDDGVAIRSDGPLPRWP
jgi:hypothetical protein